MTASVMTRAQTVFQAVFRDPGLVIRPETTAFDVDGWDSLSHVELIVALEEEFGVRFPIADTIRAKDVGELIRLIESKLSAGSTQR